MQSLGLVTYNVENGVQTKKILSTVKFFRSHGVDIFCFQETRKIPNRPFIGENILEELGSSWKEICFLDDESPLNGLGLSIFWNTHRLMLKNSQNILLPRLHPSNIVEKIFCKLFVPNATPPQRGALIASFSYFGKVFQVANVHLDLLGGMKHRTLQLTHLISSFHQAKRQIICGDLNTIGFKRNNGIRSGILQKIFGSEFYEAFPTIQFTQKIGLQNDPTYPLISIIDQFFILTGVQFSQKLDQVWLKEIKLNKAEMKQFSGSDHFPLMISFML